MCAGLQCRFAGLHEVNVCIICVMCVYLCVCRSQERLTWSWSTLSCITLVSWRLFTSGRRVTQSDFTFTPSCQGWLHMNLHTKRIEKKFNSNWGLCNIKHSTDYFSLMYCFLSKKELFLLHLPLTTFQLVKIIYFFGKSTFHTSISSWWNINLPLANFCSRKIAETNWSHWPLATKIVWQYYRKKRNSQLDSHWRHITQTNANAQNTQNPY